MTDSNKRAATRSVFVLGGIAAVLLFAWAAFATSTGVAQLDKLRYAVDEPPTLTVVDADLNTDPTTRQTNVVVNFSSTSHPNGISVTLREDGVNSSTFSDPLEAVEFSTVASNDLLNTLQVTAGDTLTLSYSDAAPLGTRTATATMYVDNATAAFDADRYALNDTATLSVSDVDANTSTAGAQTLSVDLKSSTGDTTGIQVTLTETGASTSTFTGTATFTGTGSSNNGTDVLRVNTGDTLTLTYTENLFNGTSTATRTDTATMQRNGTASLNALRYALGATPELSVTDPDEDTSVSVNLRSTTDTTGISVALGESGAGTGTFNVEDNAVEFTTSGSSDNGTNTLLVSAGDTLTLAYAETTTYEGPNANRTDIATVEIAGVASFDKLRYALDETATLTVEDLDLNTNPEVEESVDVNFKSDTDDDPGITVTLDESDADDGTFTGTATFSTLLSNDLLDVLQVTESDDLTLTYADAGPAGDREATATMYDDGATAAFNADRYALDDTATLSVDDIDANTSATTVQTLSVDLTSSTAPLGIEVTLTETGVDASTFTGTATFTGSGSSNDTSDILLVSTGDTLTLTYTENLFNGTSTASRADSATMQQDGSASLNALRYDLNDTAGLSVTDPDLNTDSESPQSVLVNFHSATDTNGVSVTLTESGNDTGTFDIEDNAVEFTTSGSSDNGTNTLLVTQGDTLTLTYAETTTYSGSDTNRTDTATIFIDSAAANLTATRYDFNDTAMLTVDDLDRNTSTTELPETLTVTLDSPNGDPINVTLTEVDADDDTFSGTATFTSAGSSNDVADILRADQGDEITLTYAEPNASGSGTTNRTDTATMFEDANATPALDALRYTTAATPALSVTHPDANSSAGSSQTITATLSSDADGNGVSVSLTESGADTGIFNVPDNAVEFVTSGTSNNTTNTLRIDPGDEITLAYAEPNASGIGTTDRTATATIYVDSATADIGAARYDFNDTATLTVNDIDANTSATGAPDTLTVHLASSTGDATGIDVTLTEVDADDDTFTGTATFASSGSSDGGTDVLRANSGDTITLTYAEPNASGAGTTGRTDTATMFADTATVEFDPQTYDLNDTATVRVTDADGNFDAGLAETVSVSVFSDSDPSGLSSLTLTETALNTGVFESTITFAGTGSSSGTTLVVAGGDTVTASYDEPNASGSGTTERTGTATMFADDATVSLDQARYAVDEDPVITVTDADRNGDASSAEEVTATLASSTNGDGIDVTLTETGNDTGIFEDSVGLTTASSLTELQVAEGDLLTATYDEPEFDGVGNTSRTANAETNLDGTASLNADIYDAGDTPTLVVADTDRNTSGSSTQTVSVNLKSTTHAAGISVTLTETGNNTGVFSEVAAFTGSGSSDDDADILRVSSGDTVTLTYAETTTFLGPDADRTDTATMTTDGSTSLDASRYDASDTVTLSVTDPDLNTSAASAQTVDVGFESSTGDTNGITVVLTETGVDASTFTGTATLTGSGSSNDTSDVLRVNQADTVTLTYAETTTFSGTDADRTDTATMFADTATVAFGQSLYAVDDTATVVVTDADANTAAGSPQAVTATLTSSTDPAGITVALTETGDDTGVFSGAATFTTGSSDDPSNVLAVAQGATVEATYVEPLFSGSTASRTDSAALAQNGTVALDGTLYDMNDTATVTVDDVDENTSPSTIQSVEVTFASETDTDGITLTLEETGANTGIFTATATFTADPSSGSALQVAGGDTVTATYAETSTFEGSSAPRTDTARILSDDAVAELNAVRYARDDVPVLTVTDTDRNTLAGIQETVTATLASDSDSEGISITLIETDLDTGIFSNNAGFTTGSSNDGTNQLQVAAGDEITMIYPEPLSDGSSTANRTDTAMMFSDDATAVLDEASYDPDGALQPSVDDADRNLDPDTAETVEVVLTSTTDGDGITIALTESGADTGVFDVEDDAVGLVDSGTSDDDTNTLRVTEGDTITLTYTEPLFAGETDSRTDTAAVADQTDPAVSITAPVDGVRVRASVAVEVDASDNVGVSEVEIFVDGISIGTDTTSPHSVSWDTTTATNGSHALTATAEDAAGNTTTSSAVTVTVDNTAPTATISTPTTLTGSATVTFNEDVKALSTTNTVLRVTSPSSGVTASLSCRTSSNASVSCSDGPVRTVILTPSAALTPGQFYAASVNPSGAATITDMAGNTLVAASSAFRASRTEQENSAAARYRWSSVGTSSAFGGSYVVDRSVGATASYAFTGTSVTWYTVTGPSFGKAQVIIDGVSKGTFNQYATGVHYKVARAFGSLSSGSHTITIKVLGQKGSTSGTDTLVAVDAFKVGSGSVVSTPKLTHTWRRIANANTSGGAYAFNNLRGADVSLTFRGTGIDWYTIAGPNQGKVNVYIDNALVASVDNYSASTKYNVRRSIRNLSNAVHTIRVQVTGSKNLSSSGTGFSIDRWVVV